MIKIHLDCFGDMCPIPVLKINKALKDLSAGESLMAVTDHSCVLASIKDQYRNSEVLIEADEVMNGVWEVLITKL